MKIQSRVLWLMWRRHVGWRGRAALLLALAALLLRVRVPLRASMRAGLRAPPHTLATHLADFNKLRVLYPHIESWKLESQWNNYTCWRYTLSYTCGARCAGAAEVRVTDEYSGGHEHEHEHAGPEHAAHGPAAGARGGYRLETCSTLPLLPWPAFCDSLEVEWWVWGAGGGSQYAERARARRALGAAAAGWLRGELATQRAQHLQALRDSLPEAAA